MTRYHPNGDPMREPLAGSQRTTEQAIAAKREQKRLRAKPQQFDVSPLPLFGDGHKQKELF